MGLVTGDALARSLAVYVGGGRAANGISATANGSAGVDLSAAAVDARSLGLRGVQAQGISTSDLGPASATSVANILSNATNQASLATAGFTDFYFRGPGFGDRNQIRVTTSLAGVTDIDTLVANSNAAIEAAGESPTAAATSFRNAGIRAAVVTDAAGRKSLSFTSASTAFPVAAGDRMANALLGNVKTVSNPAGRGLTNTVTGGSATAVAGTPFGAAGAGTIALHFRGASLPYNFAGSEAPLAGCRLFAGNGNHDDRGGPGRPAYSDPQRSLAPRDRTHAVIRRSGPTPRVLPLAG